MLGERRIIHYPQKRIIGLYEENNPLPSKEDNWIIRCDMAVHHGGKVGSAARKLASKSTSKSTKSKAGKILANHKVKHH